jgi:recombinational DNA repair protein (RecF pathway)
MLEVRLDNRLVETFASSSLAHELFLNYVNDDPISPQVCGRWYLLAALVAWLARSRAGVGFEMDECWQCARPAASESMGPTHY